MQTMSDRAEGMCGGRFLHGLVEVGHEQRLRYVPGDLDPVKTVA